MPTNTRNLEELERQDYAQAWDELEDVSDDFASIRPRKDRQLNLRVSDELLAQLRETAVSEGTPYHSLARRLIEEGLARASYQSAVAPTQALPARAFRMKEVLLVLLGAPGSSHEENEAIVGITRLQKLLFLVAQHLKPQVAAHFEAYDYGPFDEFLEPDLDFLSDEGLVEASGRESLRQGRQADGPTGKELLAWVRGRNVPDDRQVESYRLTQLGMEWVRRFLASDSFGDAEAKTSLMAECARMKEEFGSADLGDLIAHVYREHPEYASRSKIRLQVAERGTARRPMPR